MDRRERACIRIYSRNNSNNSNNMQMSGENITRARFNPDRAKCFKRTQRYDDDDIITIIIIFLMKTLVFLFLIKIMLFFR